MLFCTRNANLFLLHMENGVPLGSRDTRTLGTLLQDTICHFYVISVYLADVVAHLVMSEGHCRTLSLQHTTRRRC